VLFIAVDGFMVYILVSGRTCHFNRPVDMLFVLFSYSVETFTPFTHKLN